jgi:hypothetical protein
VPSGNHAAVGGGVSAGCTAWTEVYVRRAAYIVKEASTQKDPDAPPSPIRLGVEAAEGQHIRLMRCRPASSAEGRGSGQARPGQGRREG